jgi:hypothetical protein
MLTVRDSQVDSMAKDSPGTQMKVPCPADATWIEVQLLDRNQKPMPGEKYKIQLPDSSIMTGALDKDGKVRFDNIVAGQAQITFPEIDSREWDAAAPADPAAPGGSDTSGGSGGGGSDSSGGSGAPGAPNASGDSADSGGT